MCGFVTMYNKKNVPVDYMMLQEMTNVIGHRGPDDEGYHIKDCVGFGFRRLSIIDIENGAQPFSNLNKDITLVFNGEIYNYKELRDWLTNTGHIFFTNSDTEVLLKLYEEVGTDCPNYLRGMFSFAIWDSNKQQLFISRDPFGIKPLYYTETDDRFLFGSEIKSFLKDVDVNVEVDEDSLYHYLTFQYVPEPSTMFKSIKKLKAGHSMIIHNEKIMIMPYFEVNFNPQENRSFESLVEEARSVLTDSVKLHRNSDVSRGAFLSGGIDSSSIVAILQSLEPTKTFSVGFDMSGYSELDEARKTASILGTDHFEICITSKDYMESLPTLIWHMDEPVADPSAMGLYYVSKLASQHVKVVFSGEGADEFFGGYNIYKEPHSLRHFNYLHPQLRKFAGYISELMPENMKGKSFLERGSKELKDRFIGNAKIFSDKEKDSLLSNEFIQKKSFTSTGYITDPLYDKASHYDDITKMQYIDIHTWLRGNILTKADKMSMANSLELRVPFIDRDVFNFASTIPTKYRVNPQMTKVLLREAMKGIVPDDVQQRKKLGFPVPIRVWLKNEWYDWAKSLIETAPIEQWINKSYTLDLLAKHREGKIDASRKLWTILTFIIWHQTFVLDQKRVSLITV